MLNPTNNINIKESNNAKGQRIAINTALLYSRMLVVMIINLFTVRVVLRSLGVEDYGIYDVVAGLVSMMQSLSAVLSSSTSRYFAYYLGLNENKKLNEVFSNSIIIYGLFSLVVIILGETIGIWFLNNELVIPEERMMAANWVFQFSLFSFVFGLMSSPFLSAITAHEDINIYAIITMAEWLLKLLFALTIAKVNIDSLIYYSSYLMIVPLLSLSSYIIIARRKYAECRRITRATSMYKQILSFSGWMLFASLAGVCMVQFNTILVNVFFGPLVNAARAIALQINSALGSFSSSFLTAVKPPMIKAYSSNDYYSLNKIFDASNRFILYSLLIVCIPIFVEMDYILNLWLSVTDEQTVLFSRLIVLYAFIMALNNPISFIMHATGHVKEYHTRVEIPTIMCMPITYVLYSIGMPAYSTFVVMIIAALASHVIRMICLKRFYPQFGYRNYIFSIVVPAIIIGSLTLLIALVLHTIVEYGFLRLSIVFVLTTIMVTMMALRFGLSPYEKSLIKSFASRYIKRS